jgi:hypothetical protein
MTATSTRRAILAGAAAIPALSLPAIAEANPDAELIALGRQLDQLVIGFNDARERNAGHREGEEKAHWRIGQMLKEGSMTAQDDYLEALNRLMKDAPPPSHPTDEDFWGLLDPVQSRIAELPAKSLDGLKVKARSAKFTCSPFWDGPAEDADWDHRMIRAVIDAVLEAKSA